MTCAQIAAQVASKALQSNDLSTGFLSLYQKRCEQVIGFDMNVMLRIRRMLDALSDSKIDGLISAGRTLGLDKTLLNMKDIDFQGRSLLHVLQSPRMLAFIGYLLFLHLTVNP
jgi:flavin-dependent dehydrogenase